MSFPEINEEEYAAQRRAFHELPSDVSEKKETEPENENAVPGGRASRNRRQNREQTSDPSVAADTPVKSDSSRKAEGPTEVFGTRGYQPEKTKDKLQEKKQVSESPEKKGQGKEKTVSSQVHPVQDASGRTDSRSHSQTDPAKAQNVKMTGSIPQQNARTAGPIPQQNARTTGPIPQQNARTTGPIPQQNARTTGPIPQQNARTTGPIPQQNARTTGPIPQQNARTTGPIPQQNTRTTGPIPQQNTRTTGPIPQQNARTTGPVNPLTGQMPPTAEPQSWGYNGPAAEQRVWAANNQNINPYPNGFASNQRIPSGQEPYPPRERQNGFYAPGQNMRGQYSPNQEFRPETQNAQTRRDNVNAPMGNRAGQSSGKNEQNEGQNTSFPVRKLLIGICAVMILVVGGTFLSRFLKERADYRAMVEYVESYNDLFVPGVYIDGISLEGMNMTQAQAMVESNARQRSTAWSVNLTYNGMLVRTITSADLSMNVDVQQTLQEAWKHGHTGTVEERKAQMEELQVQPYKGETAQPSGDAGAIDTILQEINNQVYRVPQDATIASFDPNLTYPFTFNAEVIGRKLNIEAAKEAIYESLSTMAATNVELQLETQTPSITVESLKSSLLELRGSATTPISSSSAEERNANIRTAFSKITGTIVQPGGQFSFNSVVGPRTEKNGFLPAIEYAYGELSDGIGGGVCQASTTVYLAAVRAGMEILKREPHSDAVSYIEYGKDATVYWYSNHKIDMVFKNTTDSPIYITAAVQSSPTKRTNLVCVVNIYGATMNGLSYDIATQETVIEAPVEPEYVKDRNAEYVTYTDQEKVVRKASPGCSVDSWRVTYQNGKEIDRVFMYTDIYKPKAERIYVGVTQRPSK